MHKKKKKIFMRNLSSLSFLGCVFNNMSILHFTQLQESFGEDLFFIVIIIFLGCFKMQGFEFAQFV